MDTAAPQIPPGAVVIGVERRGGAANVVQYGLAEGRRQDRPVHVVAVAQPEVAWLWGVAASQGFPVDEVPVVDLAEIRADVDGLVAAALEETASTGTTTASPAIEVHVVFGQPAEILLACAREAALVVVGQPSRGVVGAALLGSVGLSCAVHADCPVLVVPPPLPSS